MTDAIDKYATSASLIDRVKSNNEDAWRELATLYQPLLEHWINEYSRQKHLIQLCDAQDIIQEVWINVRNSFPNFMLVPGRKSFRPWIRSILSRRIADFVRKKKREEKRGEAKPATDLAADLKEDFTALSEIAEAAEVKDDDGQIEIDDEKEREILLTSALRDISEKTGADPRDLRIFAHHRFANRTNAEIGEEFNTSKGNVSTIQNRVKKVLNEVYGYFLE